MAIEVTKSPKINPKFTSKTSKKVSFSKKSTKEGTQNRSNPLKISSLESNKKKFDVRKKKFDEFSGRNSENWESKRKFGDMKKKMKENTENPTKVSSFLNNEKKMFSDEKKTMEGNSLKPSKVPNWVKVQRKFGDKKKKFKSDLAEEIEAKPKKKKRVIKIDPYDTSNKRIDYSNVLTDTTNQKKKVEVEEDDKVELSQNAQFRAIEPSSSILSFVEDNLLGRRRDIELRKAGYNTELSAPLDNIPFSMSSERERIEESLFRNKLDFLAAAKVSTSFPLPGLPEIAFAGRSNVGKSSLLNSLTRQWGVVRTSDKPGHTQSINFFKLGTKVNLVDLPGYGFAYAKEEVKESWEELVKEYVSTRIGLKRVCLLVDTKWGLKPRDRELVHLMERSQTKYQIVLTKTDTVFPLDVARRAMQIEETFKEHRSIVHPVMMVSSKSGAGIRCLRTALAKIARFVKP